jgi:pantoate--beta-alanine ligase
MKVFNKIYDLKQEILKIRSEKKTLGFVPTMGALHEGHISLINKAHSETDFVCCSIFVNPTQFNDKSDFDRYPRTLPDDIKILEAAGCHYVFAPSTEEMYPVPPTETFDFGLLGNVMEGAFRPGHFNGVAIIVKKLFEIVTPDKAYFGKKDFQQLCIIRALVKMFSIPLEIIGCDTLREPDGLAMSSRNRLLTPDERVIASHIPVIMRETSSMCKSQSVTEIKNWVAKQFLQFPECRLDYFEISEPESLQPIQNWQKNQTCIACIAVFVNKIRLIDNIEIHCW